jgi:hypothetical protein
VAVLKVIPHGWTEPEVQWVLKKWSEIRQAQRMADKANNDWKTINAAINDKHVREDMRRAEQGQFPLTDLMKAQAKEASLPLKDALSTGSWHSRNAERHIADVNLFLKMKEMGLL